MASRCAEGSSSVGCGAVGLRRRFSEGEKGFGGCEMGIPAAAEVGGGEKLRGRSRFFPVFWGAEGWLCWGKALLGSAEGW